MPISDRMLLLAAGLLGAMGVAMAAAASHAGDGRLLGNASLMCLAHAPALLALFSLADRVRFARLSGLLLAAGTMLFTADLASRHFWSHGLFPMAAPSGGILMIAGWISLVLATLMRPRT